MPMCLATIEAYRYMCDKLHEEITIGGETVFRKDLLIGKIKANGMTYINVAQNMGVTTQTLRNKMMHGDFRAEEIRVLVEMLGLTDTELLTIFFDREIN